MTRTPCNWFVRAVPAPLLAAAAVVLCAVPASAEVKLPAVFGDHMVLQQKTPVTVWGWAEPGEKVTVSVGPQKKEATAGDDRKWRVKLEPLAAGGEPVELTVAGKDNSVTLKDVLVGEVWVCSGQSNMEWSVKQSKDPQQEIAAANHPKIRLFTVPKNPQDRPQEQIKKSDKEGKWEVCSPATVGDFSAVGYYFGRELQKELGVPVGLIDSTWGGTIAEAWAEQGALEKESDFSPILARARDATDNYPRRLEDWQKAAEKARAEGKPAPRKPPEPGNDPNRASVLYNGMIAPIVPIAIRGAIWYQGESNAGRAEQYRKLLPAMIQSWRDAWNQDGAARQFPFLIVSLANFQDPPKEPADSDWAELREAQTLTANLPNNGQALAIDLADENNPRDIHPRNKQDVGKRLALVALGKVYDKHLDYEGPAYESMKVEGNKVRVKFKHAEGLKTKDGGPAKGFAVAGDDRKWYWAEGATVEGDTVVVWSDKVLKPVAVRYAWAHNPPTNLYDAAGLPAVPFRTDDWPGATAGKR
jgi:sialate O-acetylesterase